MLGTYASFLALFGAAALIGQALICASGRRQWSWLAPAVGLAALGPIAWWTVRLPGEGLAAAIAIAVCCGLGALWLRGRVAGVRSALASLPLALTALIAASLPLLVAGRFGILGTGLNPDMSQHLFAVDRLAGGLDERLISEGYPLGPHSLVVALAELGPSTVQAFDGLTLAIAVAACLAPLALFNGLTGWRRFAGALCVGFAYLVSAYLVQGAFKETLQALFVLAFAIGLAELAEGAVAGGPRRRLLLALPLAVIALGSVYVYSFPGLLWLLGAAAVWAAVELAPAARRGGGDAALATVRRVAAPALIAIGVVILGTIPELGRIIEFARFETFSPDGAGLGNLFDRLSPAEALGLWPSGDFRVEPGDGSIPAAIFYLGSVAGLAALGFGLAWWWRHGERAVPAALMAALLLWAYALLVGTPYQEAKALALAAPLVALISVRALAAGAPAIVAAVFLAAAGGSGLLALANGPVGPSGYSPELAELRDELGDGSVTVYAPAELLDDQHGRDYLVWELRGNRICVEEGEPGTGSMPATSPLTVTVSEDGAVVPESTYLNRSVSGGSCPFIPDGARADPSAAGD